MSTLPVWLRGHLRETCLCGKPIVNSPNFTQRLCSDFYCPYHMKHRIVALAKFFDIQGIGPARAEELIRIFKLKSHVAVIPRWFKEKPKLFLWEIGQIAYVPGVNKTWQELAGGAYTFEEVVQKSDGRFLEPWLPYLNYVKKFFEVKQPLAQQSFNIMLTGSITGYNNRSQYVADLNEKYGHLFRIVDIGKRKSNCDALIKEAYTSDHSKSALALSAGIPIYTSAEFNQLLEEAVARRLQE